MPCSDIQGPVAPASHPCPAAWSSSLTPRRPHLILQGIPGQIPQLLLGMWWGDSPAQSPGPPLRLGGTDASWLGQALLLPLPSTGLGLEHSQPATGAPEPSGPVLEGTLLLGSHTCSECPLCRRKDVQGPPHSQLTQQGTKGGGVSRSVCRCSLSWCSPCLTLQGWAAAHHSAPPFWSGLRVRACTPDAQL